MLRQRVITALILGSILAAAIFLLPTAWFVVLLAAVLTLGVLEWAGLSQPGLGGWGNRAAAVAVAIVALSLALAVAPRVGGIVTAVVGTVLWCIQAILLKTESPLLPFAHGVLIAGAMTTTIALTNIAWLHQLGLIGPALVCVFFVIVSGADSGAYFAGRAFGKHRLAPLISPGKTVEGFAGGLVVATLATIIGLLIVVGSTDCQAWPTGIADWLGWVVALSLIGAATAAASVVGDLTESLAKRTAGVKDSGTLLPGHGGVLDRIDGMLAAAPVFALGVWLLGIDSACR